MSTQAKTISLTKLTASVGTVRVSGSAGVGRADLKAYSPAGYSPIFGTWEVNAANSNVTLKFAVPATAPSTLDTPILVIHNYAVATLPRKILLDGVLLKANIDYFASLRTATTELWLTLNKKLTGTHTLSVIH